MEIPGVCQVLSVRGPAPSPGVLGKNAVQITGDGGYGKEMLSRRRRGGWPSKYVCMHVK